MLGSVADRVIIYGGRALLTDESANLHICLIHPCSSTRSHMQSEIIFFPYFGMSSLLRYEDGTVGHLAAIKLIHRLLDALLRHGKTSRPPA